ncbi:MAG: hypothetical protein ACKOTZ_07315 [Chloroflexota bacterium]
MPSMQPRAGRGPRGERGRTGIRLLAASVAAVLVLGGCGVTPAPPGPSLPPAAPSASPEVETAPDRCALLDRVMQSLEDLRLVRLRPANRDILGRIVETVRIDWDDVRRAPFVPAVVASPSPEPTPTAP